MKLAYQVVPVLLALAVPPVAQEPAATQPRLSRLQGRAAVDRRHDVVGATVMVQECQDASRLYLTSSGENGNFLVDGLPDGEYRVWVARPGLEPVSKDRVSVRFPFRAVVEITMRPGADLAEPARPTHDSSSERIVLRGRVRELDGQPMPEVRVRLVRLDGGLDPVSLRTGADGRFALPDLAAGEWRLELQGVGFLPIRQLIDLADDTELSITMVRQPAQYEPSPLELMPPEQPVPPEDWVDLR